MLSQSEFRPNVYMVGWPELGILKAGSAFRLRRWKNVARVGGELVAFAEVREFPAALSLEAETLTYLSTRYPAAFRSRLEATGILSDGRGWTECFRVPPSEWEAIAKASLSDRTCDGVAIANRSQTIAVTATESATASEGRTIYGWLSSTTSSSYVSARVRDGVVEQ